MNKIYLTILGVLLCSVSFVYGDTPPTLLNMEYWFNDDFINRQTKTVSGSSTELNINLNTSNLKFGQNTVHYRFRDSNGRYSAITSYSFFKKPNVSNMALMEYWFNNDYAKKKTVAASFNELSAYLETGDLPFGNHLLHIRVKSGSGSWSSIRTSHILKTGKTGVIDKVPRISGYRYWFDGDISKPVAVELESNTSNADLNIDIPTSFSAGEHTISIQFKDTRTHLSQVFTSKFKAFKAVSGVEISHRSIQLIAGASFQLSAKISPEDATNQAVNWYSEDTNIAHVNDAGKVTAVNGGKTTITVATLEGNRKDVCEVEVIVPVTGVQMEESSITVGRGYSRRLQANVLPENATNKKLLWTSNKTGIATVDELGNVTGISDGTAVITAKTEDGNKTATCSVKVTTYVESIHLNKTEVTLEVDKTEQLSATISPSNATNKNFTWSSDNSSIAAIDNKGKITAKQAGTAIITATTEDGSKTANCLVTVTNKIVAVTNINLNKTELTLEIDDSEQLIATIQPSNATNQSVIWSSSNSAIVSVDDGFVTANAEGTAIINVTTIDGSFTASCHVTVAGETGIDNVSSSSISIFPNPARDELYIRSEHLIEKVEICSLSGSFLLSENNFKEKINVSVLPQGVYVLKIYTDKGIAISKVVKE